MSKLPDPAEFDGVIAVVDDDEYIVEALQWWLTSEGYKVSVHLNARSLLARLQPVANGWSLREGAEAPIHLGAVLADLNMPGMSGLELASELRRHAPELPVVIATAAGALEQEEITAKGIIWLKKPFSIDDVEALLLNKSAA